mmetsp:Transcript_799/g.2176  ORF Transcript_799/g.2176 Transcript_799/m.2176 type:complete len:213 (+) Transcript_799:316-954(+)
MRVPLPVGEEQAPGDDAHQGGHPLLVGDEGVDEGQAHAQAEPQHLHPGVRHGHGVARHWVELHLTHLRDGGQGQEQHQRQRRHRHVDEVGHRPALDVGELVEAVLLRRVHVKVVAVERNQEQADAHDVQHLEEHGAECAQEYDGPHVVEAVGAEGLRDPHADGAHHQQQHHKNVEHRDEEGVASRLNELVESDEVDDLPCLGPVADVKPNAG